MTEIIALNSKIRRDTMFKTIKLILLTKIALAGSVSPVPPGFAFGVATASYQVEGGWNASGEYYPFFQIHSS